MMCLVWLQVELYFGEHDAQVGFYSTRNELEALNSILLLVNNSLSGQMYKQVNVLQHLQELLIDKIQKMGNKYNEKTKFGKSYICDKEKILVQWGEDNGVRMKLEIACKFSRLRLLFWYFLISVDLLSFFPSFLPLLSSF